MGGKLLLAEEVKVPRKNQTPLEGKLQNLNSQPQSLESSDTVFKTAQAAKDPTQIIISLKTVDHKKKTHKESHFQNVQVQFSFNRKHKLARNITN